MTTREDTKATAIKISSLEEKIRDFDSTLVNIQELLSDDIRVYDNVVEARDAIFRLQQAMRGCEIVEFATSGLDDIVYQRKLNDLFWDKDKKDDKEEEF